jgi:hypothetical protein
MVVMCKDYPRPIMLLLSGVAFWRFVGRCLGKFWQSEFCYCGYPYSLHCYVYISER